jgi:hypothetical protein
MLNGTGSHSNSRRFAAAPAGIEDTAAEGWTAPSTAMDGAQQLVQERQWDRRDSKQVSV